MKLSIFSKSVQRVRSATLRVCFGATVASVLLLTACGTGPSTGGSVPTTPLPELSSIKHIVVFVQENRSFDHYFGMLNKYRVANGLTADVDGLDKVTPQPPSNPSYDNTSNITSFKMTTVCTQNVSPSWNESHVQRNRFTPDISNPALMNGFVFTAGGYSRTNNLSDTEGIRGMGYYDQDALPFYYYMATHFAISDRFFSPVMAKSEPNRLFIFAATSEGNIAIPQQTLSSKTIFHELNDKGVNWKIYTTEPGVTTLSYFQPFADQHKDRVVPLDQYFTDLQNDTLPDVAYVETGFGSSALDEHPGNNIQNGAAHAAKIINALTQSKAWATSVFFQTYDEGGGLYDHVGPQPAVNPDGHSPMLTASELTTFGDNFTMTGMRIPLMVISPFAKKGYVSHTVMDTTAILRFIEERFGLPNLNERDKAQPSMAEFFDFTKQPDVTPPTPPAQPTNAPCYYDRVP